MRRSDLAILSRRGCSPHAAGRPVPVEDFKHTDPLGEEPIHYQHIVCNDFSFGD